MMKPHKGEIRKELVCICQREVLLASLSSGAGITLKRATTPGGRSTTMMIGESL